MSSGEITDEVTQFIYDHICSVEQLEILLLVSASREKEWSALEVSKKLYSQPDSVELKLASLHTAGILSVSQESPRRYCYKPPSTSVDLLVQLLERAYRVRKDAVIRLILSKPNENIRIFSDAFRLWKKD